MKHLIEDLLDIARIEAGRLTIEEQRCAVGALLAEALDLMQPLAQQKRLRIERQVPGQEVYVRCDRPRVLRVLSNLIGNSIKYVPNGKAPAVEVWTEENLEGVSLLIKDNGPGIQREHRERLFSPLIVRPHPNGTGTGLGLTITQNALVQLGGEVDFSSEENAGTLFRVKLRSSPSRTAVSAELMDVPSPTIATHSPFDTSLKNAERDRRET